MVCDAPAKIFIKRSKNHKGYFSYAKCTQEGEFINNKVCFTYIYFIMRTDNDFLLQKQKEQHIGTSILQEIPDLGLVTSFPLDYMHLIFLGGMKIFL